MQLLKNKQLLECANAIKQGNNHYRYDNNTYKITENAKKFINLYQFGIIIPCLIVLLTKDIVIYNYTVSTIARLVIAIIILDTITHNYTKNNFAKINEQLEQIKKISKNIAKEEKERESDKNSKQQELQEKIKIMEEDWQAINKNTAFYIEHEELEKVNASMIKFKSYIQLEEYTEAIPELENCKYILDHIRDKEAMQIINLF